MKSKVKLISKTQPLEQHPIHNEVYLTIDEYLVWVARLSHESTRDKIETTDIRLKQFINEGHWSVFEQATLGFQIECPRYISQQILRHKSMFFQEASQRRMDIDREFGEITIDNFNLRYEDSEKKWQSDETTEVNTDVNYNTDLFNSLHNYFTVFNALSRELKKSNIAKECIRQFYPLVTPTRICVTGTIRSWIHFIKARTQPDAQLEIREIANKIKEIFIQELPLTSKALQWII